jgi:hypothetical protein
LFTPPLAEDEPVAKQAAYDAATGGENRKLQQKPVSRGGAPQLREELQPLAVRARACTRAPERAGVHTFAWGD